MARRRRRSSSASSQHILAIFALALVGYIVIDKGWDKKFLELAGSWDAVAESQYGLPRIDHNASPQRGFYDQRPSAYRYEQFPPPTGYRVPGPTYQQSEHWQ